MFILGWVTVTADADYGLYALFHSSSSARPATAPSGRTRASTSSSTSAADLEDPEEREAIYVEAQEIIAEEAPVDLPLHHDRGNAPRQRDRLRAAPGGPPPPLQRQQELTSSDRGRHVRGVGDPGSNRRPGSPAARPEGPISPRGLGID
jgi:hypothetical protein